MQQIAFSNPLINIKTSLPPLIFPTHQIQTKTYLQNPKISAKGSRRRSGSQKSRKLIIDSIAFVASNLKILPEPLDSLVREFWVEAAAGGGGGNGGKFWLRRGFGGGGGGGRRRSKTEKLGFWVALVLFTASVWWVVVEREKQSDSFFWVLLGVSAFAVFCLVKGWRREIKDWILEFSCGAALMGVGLGLRNNGNFVRLVDGTRSNNFPNFMAIARKRRRNRRWI